MVTLRSKEVNNTSIASFYAGKSVFITGGTGFIGKVFVEKLLYCCPDIDKIYMLIREKKGISSSQRKKQLIDDPLFQRLTEKKPTDLEKIVVIPGDINSPHLGITADDESLLVEQVSVLVHLAAVVKFNETLPVAWNMNVEGTKKVLALSRKMKRLETFIHTSTAYSNLKREVIDEVLYPPPADINEVYQYVKEGVTEEQTKKILNGYPNTYAFTKALAEHLVMENQEFVPTIIVRPSIVAAVKDAPIRGWLANWFGATGFAVLTIRGVNRVVYGHENNTLDLIPVDYVANLMIIAGARCNKSNELKVYNCCSSSCNPIIFKKILDIFLAETIKHKSGPVLLPGWCIFTKHKSIAKIVTIVFQLIPAYFADLYLRLIGKSPRFMNLYSLVVQIRNTLDFFTYNSWVMKAEKVRELYASLSPADQSMFPCDPATIDWVEYLKDYYWGVRQLEQRK